MVLYYILLILGIVVSLFASLTYLFGWSSRYRWTFLITKTESSLKGIPLHLYRICKALWVLLYGVWFFLCFFDHLSKIRLLLLFLIVVISIGIEVYFSKAAKRLVD